MSQDDNPDTVSMVRTCHHELLEDYIHSIRSGRDYDEFEENMIPIQTFKTTMTFLRSFAKDLHPLMPRPSMSCFGSRIPRVICSWNPLDLYVSFYGTTGVVPIEQGFVRYQVPDDLDKLLQKLYECYLNMDHEK